jgi:hypothetical protein
MSANVTKQITISVFHFREEAIRQYQEERRKRREKDESQVSTIL